MNLAQSFQQAQNAFNGGDMWTASRVCDDMIKRAPGHPDVLHLMALVCRRQGQLREAEKHFRSSLVSKPKQPAVLSNLGNLLKQSRRYAEADEAYRRALKHQPDLGNAWYNRGLMALEQGRHQEAIEHLERASDSQPNINVELALIKAYREAGDLEKARQLADDLLQRHPGDVRAVGASASVRRKQDPSSALELLEAELGRTADPAAIHYELGLVYSNQQDFERAAEHFDAAVQAQPTMIQAHRSLNEIYWQQEDPRFLESYRDAIEKAPNDAPLYHNLAAAQISAGNDQEAADTLLEAVSRSGRDPHLVHALAVQKHKLESWDTAEQLFNEALQSDPDNLRFLVDCANLMITSERYEQATSHLARALELQPYNQEVWAYQGVVWRLTSDPRHDWLNDYDRLLKVYDLPVPDGFESIEAFMSELVEYLPGLHSAKRQPLDQSVRNGTQTFELLFDNPHPLIAELKRGVQSVLAEYLKGMPRDPKHPFYSRLGAGTRFTGSWSIILRSGGHHTNHIHPYGWLSCCNYIALPPLKSEKDKDRSGWIRFGETSMQLGKREKVARAIRPEPGKCVFFPSYFWHGTYKFESEQPRMTVPCDIDPA
jgi:Tfp pilus assembly protein PilF